MDMVLMGTNSGLNRFSAPGKKEEQLALNLMERLDILHFMVYMLKLPV